MNIKFVNKKLNQIISDCELIFVINKKTKHKWVKDEKIFKQENFKSGEDEMLYLPNKNRIYVGVNSFAVSDLRNAIAQAVQVIATKSIKSLKLGIYYNDSLQESIKGITEGVILGSYTFTKYKSKKKAVSLKNIYFGGEEYNNQNLNEEKIKRGIMEGRMFAEATNFVRDLVNQTPSDITPPSFAEAAKNLAKENKLEIKVNKADFLQKENMGAFLAVGRASEYEPHFIQLKYKPKKAIKKIALIGKGLTYDTGGLSLKPSESMVTMKMDMGGAGAVLGIIKAISEMKLDIEVHGYLGVTENAIGKKAYKPDDILVARNKNTIEVRNTDAEGRLVLADCLNYAQDKKYDFFVDIATLTGACVVGLGEYTIGVMGNNKKLKQSILEAGNRVDELAVDLPFNKYLAKTLKSEIADISNMSNSRYGGAITAGLFLDNFIKKENKDRWVHIDIAGPAFSQKPWGYNASGASGSGVRMISEWIKQLTQEQ